jgi:photosystem II stability/assembly factor-like uncharacterized protein
MTHKSLYGANKKRSVKGESSYFALPPPSNKFKRTGSYGDGIYSLTAYNGGIRLPGEQLPFDAPGIYNKKAEVVTSVALPIAAGGYQWKVANIDSLKILAVPYNLYGSDTITQVTYSTDGGSSWSIGTVSDKQYSAVCATSAAYYILATTGEIYTSTTGASWSYVGTVTVPDLSQTTSEFIFKAGTFYVFAAAYNTNATAVIASSSDCVSWSYASDSTISKAWAFAVNDAGVLAVAAVPSYSSYLNYNYTAFFTNSTVGGTWTRHNLIGSIYFQASDFTGPLKSYGNSFYMLATNGAVYITNDNFTTIKNYANLAQGFEANALMALSNKYVITGSLSNSTVTGILIRDLTENLQASGIEVTPLNVQYEGFMSLCFNAVTLDDTTFGVFNAPSVGVGFFKKFTIDKAKSYAVFPSRFVMFPQLSDFAASYIAIDDNVNPADYPGYSTMDYNPGYGTALEGKFKQCDGSSTYSNASASLKALFPKVNVTFCGVVERSALGAVHLGSCYTGSTIVLVNVNTNTNDISIITSTDEGATWTVAQTIAGAGVAYADLNLPSQSCLAYDGSTYYLAATNSINQGVVYTFTSPSGALTATSLNPTNYPGVQNYRVVSVSSSSTVALGHNGSVYQTTNHGASWTLITTLTGTVSAVNNITKIGSDYYVLCLYGIYKSSNMLSFTEISASTAAGSIACESLVYHIPTNTWMTYDVNRYTGYTSTDNMTTWSVSRTGLRVNAQYTIGNYIMEPYGRYAVSPNGPTYALNMPLVDVFRQPITGGYPLTIGSGNQLILWKQSLYQPIGLTTTPYILSFDTSVMQMPMSGNSTVDEGLGCWMRIVD